MPGARSASWPGRTMSFYADRFADLFAQAGKPVPVTLVPGVNHMGLTLDAQAVATVARHACPA